jgi:nonsense-mediated mRNA decay protein 3
MLNNINIFLYTAMNLKTKFCVKCGKETKKLVDSLCEDCYFEANKISLPRSITIEVCRKCGAVKWKSVWIKTEFPLEYYLSHLLIEKARIPENIELEDLKIKGSGKESVVEVSLKVLNKRFEQIIPVSIEVQKRVCQTCSIKAGKSYRAKIQVRAERDIISKALDFSQKFKEDITKIEEQERGIDLLFIDKEPAKQLAADLKAEFNLRMSRTSEQYSWDKMKNRPKYRLVILLEQR